MPKMFFEFFLKKTLKELKNDQASKSKLTN